MNDLLAFLDRIEADPNDHILLGAFADWLGDRGDPRAGIVRAGDELARAEREFRAAWAGAERGAPAPADLDALRNRYYDRDAAVRAALGAASRVAERALAARRVRALTRCGFVVGVDGLIRHLRGTHDVVAGHPIREARVFAGWQPPARTPPLPPLPLVRSVAVAHFSPTRVDWAPGPPPEARTADLDAILDAGWLDGAEALVVVPCWETAEGESAGPRPDPSWDLLRWAGWSVPAAVPGPLPAVRVGGAWRWGPRTGDNAAELADRVGAFCQSPLVDRATELDLGRLCEGLTADQLDTILSLPFGGVRTLRLELGRESWDEDSRSEPLVDDEVRVVLDDAVARWVAEGRTLEYRGTPGREEGGGPTGRPPGRWAGLVTARPCWSPEYGYEDEIDAIARDQTEQDARAVEAERAYPSEPPPADRDRGLRGKYRFRPPRP